jgi:sulfur-oxidizing protein SoxY
MGTGALGATALAGIGPAAGQDAPAKSATPVAKQAAPQSTAGNRPPINETFDAAYERLVAGRKPIDGKLNVEIPELAENGNTVPFTVSADSPMTEASHVTAIHVLSTDNPQALIATYRFTPASGKAAVASRIRLAKTQDVICLAELSDGALWSKRTTVKVTIGGCGG